MTVVFVAKGRIRLSLQTDSVVSGARKPLNWLQHWWKHISIALSADGSSDFPSHTRTPNHSTHI